MSGHPLQGETRQPQCDTSATCSFTFTGAPGRDALPKGLDEQLHARASLLLSSFKLVMLPVSNGLVGGSLQTGLHWRREKALVPQIPGPLAMLEGVWVPVCCGLPYRSTSSLLLGFILKKSNQRARRRRGRGAQANLLWTWPLRCSAGAQRSRRARRSCSVKDSSGRRESAQLRLPSKLHRQCQQRGNLSPAKKGALIEPSRSAGMSRHLLQLEPNPPFPSASCCGFVNGIGLRS